MKDINQILDKIEYLPPFPVTVNKALAQLKNPEISTDEIAEIIKFDQAVATKLGVRGTPGYFINGVQLRGAQPFHKFKAIIDRWLQQQGAGAKPEKAE